MAHTLEGLTPGTPVFCGDTQVGEVRALYSEGHSRIPALIAVGWMYGGRTDDVAVPAEEVETVSDRGVELIQSDPENYATLASFDPARFPTVHPLS
jgi:hypothetical protein